MDGWKARWSLVGDVRGLGPMRLAELVRDRQTREPAPDETLAVIREAVARGVVVMRAGLYSNGIRLLPPLVMSEDVLREGLGVLGEAIGLVAERTAGALRS